MFARGILPTFVAIGVCLVVASPLVVRDSTPTCSRNYTVAPGDTCDAISASQNVSTYQLAVNNPDIDAACDNLQADQVLCLAVEGEDCTTLHTVIQGDTCSAILTDANITINLLIENNPNVDAGCTNIYPGEVLCTANTTVYSTQ